MYPQPCSSINRQAMACFGKASCGAVAGLQEGAKESSVTVLLEQ